MKTKYTQQDLDKVLDKLKQGPLGKRKDWQWDNSAWMSTNGNIAKSKEAREKMSSKAKDRCKDGWSTPNRYEWTVEDNPNKGGLKGKDNPVFGKGAIYRELSTGFEGTFFEMKTRFPGFATSWYRRVKGVKKYPGHKWIKIQDGLQSLKEKNTVIHFTPEQVLAMKKEYVENITVSAQDLGARYNLHYSEITAALANRKHFTDSSVYGPPVEIRRISYVVCEQCNKVVRNSDYTRWHGDNCKHKQ